MSFFSSSGGQEVKKRVTTDFEFNQNHKPLSPEQEKLLKEISAIKALLFGFKRNHKPLSPEEEKLFKEISAIKARLDDPKIKKELEKRGLERAREYIAELKARVKIFPLIRASRGILCSALLTSLCSMPLACGGNGGNSDGGPDTDTDTDTDTDVTCDNVDYDFNSVPAAKCFCPGDGDQVLEITEEEILAKFTDPDTIANLRRLIGVKMNIPEGAFDECVVVAMARANITLTEDADGAMVDSQNPDDKIVSRDAVEFRTTSASDPYGPEVQPDKDITLEFPDWFGTVYKWVTSGTPHFEITEPTIIDATGVKFVTPSLSPYAVKNRPFSDYNVNFVPGSQGGYDIDEDDGVLVELTLKDEEKAEFPTWVKFSVTDGTDTYTMTPTGEPGKYRVAVFDKHDLTFQVADNNAEPSEQHKAEVIKTFDPTIDLCEDVVCGINADCAPDTGECACDPGTDGDPDVACADINGCAGDPCDPYGTCTDVPAPGVGFECTDINECTEETDDCNTHEDCINQDPGFDCECKTGYTGTDCAECDTTGGYIPSNAVPGDCVDDPCDPEACNDHGDCSVSPTDTVVCDCEDGYTGENCETLPAAPTVTQEIDAHCGAYCDRAFMYAVTLKHTGVVTEIIPTITVTGGFTPGTFENIQDDGENITADYYPSIDGGGEQETIKFELKNDGGTVSTQQTNIVL